MNKATFWRQKSPGVVYWRTELPAKYLPGKCVDLDYTDIQAGETEETKVFPRQEGVAIWQHPGNRARALMMMGMRQNGIRVLVEVDDNYLELPPVMSSDWALALNAEDKHSRAGHRICLEQADGVIVSTPDIAKKYAQVIEKPIYVCPNSVDPEDWEDVDKPDDGIFRIGWAASASHFMDASLVRRALKWASQQHGVEIVLLGSPLAFRDFDFKYVLVDWTDTLADYRKSLQVLDVGLCPLRAGDSWANGKSDVKAMEYAMAGAMSICSDVEPYQPWKDKPALFARSGKGFEKAVRWVVQHRDEVPKIAAQAREYVLSERTIQRNIWRWQEAVGD